MRERDAQLDYKKKKQDAVREVDQKYIRLQQEVSGHLLTCLETTVVAGEGKGNGS